VEVKLQVIKEPPPFGPAQHLPAGSPSFITLPSGSGAGESSQARGSGRFAAGIMRHWSFPGWGGEKHPASFCGDPVGNLGNGFLPADAARAHRPEPRATNRDSVKVKVGKDNIP